jgi:uncharacterized Fe-S cluster-containing protein
MSDDTEKCVVVFLKDGSSVESEYMGGDHAQAEFERILEEKPGQGSANELIRVGKRAAFKSGEFSHIEIRGEPVYYLAKRYGKSKGQYQVHPLVETDYIAR